MPIFDTNPPVRPINFQKAIVFIDGTNLFHRLEGEKLNLTTSLNTILTNFTQNRQIIRMYLYTIQEQLEKASKFHGDHITKDIRVVYGEGIKTKDGNTKEKGVDALLVGDLIYHAAMKNYDYALLVSTDTDFVQPLRRVEDFGCRTGVLGICCDLPERLRNGCDQPETLSKERILQQNWAKSR